MGSVCIKCTLCARIREYNHKNCWNDSYKSTNLVLTGNFLLSKQRLRFTGNYDYGSQFDDMVNHFNGKWQAIRIVMKYPGNKSWRNLPPPKIMSKFFSNWSSHSIPWIVYGPRCLYAHDMIRISYLLHFSSFDIFTKAKFAAGSIIALVGTLIHALL